MRSNLFRSTRLMASSALWLEFTCQPSSDRISVRKLHVSRSSSITRMVFITTSAQPRYTRSIFMRPNPRLARLDHSGGNTGQPRASLELHRGNWKPDAESSSPPGFALHIYQAPVVRDYLFHDRKPQPSSQTALGCEQWIED